MYANGTGVAKDVAEAVTWFRKAAEQGHPPAQYLLGYYYALGEGLETNFVMTYMWFHLSALSGDSNGARSKEVIAGEMSASQIAKAMELAARRLKNGN